MDIDNDLFPILASHNAIVGNSQWTVALLAINALAT